ncbi:uncharacterized protein LOC6034626 [Culex quinquefasciatus]|uniref:uncharacterized protein LOC6034626 n=1 Tax=Culex quinquefasciatus TaxID=7176 RepID=UPI0018E2EADC|nr:uncharacterized protein LOC6034626 [Culex quinquefasciatus]
MFKVIVLASCLVSIALAGYEQSHGWDWDSKYKFEYGVKDPHTGDHKSQWEISDGKHGLKGGYTLDEADGTKRVVQYKADKWNGFQAIVKRIGHAVHPQTYAAPFVVKKQDSHNGNGYQKQQQQLGQDSYGQSINGVGFWKQPQQQQQQNGWVDQQPASSSNSLMMVLVQIGVAFGMSVTVVFLTTPKVMTSLLVVSIDLRMRRMTHSLHSKLIQSSISLSSSSLRNTLATINQHKMSKFVILLALVAVVAAEYHEEHYAHPKYKFEYGVKDSKTGDNKDQWEHRDGDVVKGQYSFYEADGTKRIVEYSSDKHHGFQAHVKRVGHASHPQVYGHHEEGGHHFGGAEGHHGHGHAESYANLYQHHH